MFKVASHALIKSKLDAEEVESLQRTPRGGASTLPFFVQDPTVHPLVFTDARRGWHGGEEWAP